MSDQDATGRYIQSRVEAARTVDRNPDLSMKIERAMRSLSFDEDRNGALREHFMRQAEAGIDPTEAAARLEKEFAAWEKARDQGHER